MEFLPEWISAGAASFTLFGVGINWAIIRPISQKLVNQNLEIEEQRKVIELVKERQEQRLQSVGMENNRLLDDIRNRLEQHERSDAERFDDTGERMLSMIDGLRKEINLGHTNSTAQMKTDTDRGFNSVREDLRALTSRFDSLASMLTEAMNRRRSSD